MLEKAQWVYCKSNLYGKGLDIVGTIFNEIGENMRHMFELSKYLVVYLMKLGSMELTWSPGIVHHLLLRQMVSNDAEGV